MRTAIYPGSFDPVTNGHVDIIRRASRMFERVIIVVMNNSAKRSLFSVEERVKMIETVTADAENVEVDVHGGLLIDYCIERDIRICIRGLRAVTDFDYELQSAQTNKALSQGRVDTVFLTTSLNYSYVSSSVAKEIASYGGDVSLLVPEFVAAALHEKYRGRDHE